MRQGHVSSATAEPATVRGVRDDHVEDVTDEVELSIAELAQLADPIDE
jgi:hypothetical protein